MQRGQRELWAAIFPETGLVVSIGLFSALVNMLAMTGPLFMLQVYDRVLGSRSEETLAALIILVSLLYISMGVLDCARGRLVVRIGVNFQSSLDARVFSGVIKSQNRIRHTEISPLANLESVQRLFASSTVFALLDLPWVPVYIFVIFAFHTSLGWLALGGGAALIMVAIINQYASSGAIRASSRKSAKSDSFASEMTMSAEVLRGLGMETAVKQRWMNLRGAALDSQLMWSDSVGVFGNFTKILRLFLQSAMLALGAYLVLQDEVSAGAMIASSIILGRALAPIEQSITQWPTISRAVYAWRQLAAFLGRIPAGVQRIKLPTPEARLDVEGIVVIPPDSTVPCLRVSGLTFKPGRELGVIGRSASGKSTFARVLAGVWPCHAGSIRLGDVNIGHFGGDIGRYIGYLPQDVTLFGFTVVENISRLRENVDPKTIVDAAKKAGAHEMILGLKDGYDTMIGNDRCPLSGGQKQRIGLARAMFGNPVLLILDEPNANLDTAGISA